MKLRPYQEQSINIAIKYLKKNSLPCVLELATGAGKSIIVAEIAKEIHRISNKSILCLAPSKELVEQNRAKYLASGNPASIFSASSGAKCLKHPVVFGTPLTVLNSIEKFGNRFAMVIIDECHGITPTIKSIIESIRIQNKLVRVLGLSATPYRMNTGYVYAVDEKNKMLDESEAKEPYFHKLLYKLQAHELIEQGYLTPPTIGQIGEDNYDTSTLELNKMGKYDANEVDRVFVGQGRKTYAIVNDVINKSRDRQGVMFFASTVKHANEIMESLPSELSDIVTGETKKSERESILKRFKAKQIKYLVNVSVLTTGFDASHVDVIAVLRATESAALYQQIVGRGLRLDDNKEDCLILDYAENIERFFPDGDLFNPEIKVRLKKQDTEIIECYCPSCEGLNRFAAVENKDGFKIDKNGYFTDLMGIRIESEYGATPAHQGRRCKNIITSVAVPDGVQCDYRWTHKECSNCGLENDITARYCKECRFELVDPNEKLVFDFKKMKKDPHQLQIDEVLDYVHRSTISQNGNECIRVDFTTPYRNFSIWLQKNPKNERALRDLKMFEHFKDNIKTVTYKKEMNNFYKVLNYNEEVQECPVNTQSK